MPLQLSQRCEKAEALAEALHIEKTALEERLGATEERLQAAIASGRDSRNAVMAENERRAAALNEVCICQFRCQKFRCSPVACLAHHTVMTLVLC